MDSLREIVKFVSMGRELDGMRGVPNFVPVLSSSERASMRAMINALLHLPSISLDAEDANTNGQVPLLATLTVHPSAGVIHSTTVIVSLNGRVVGGPSALPNQLQTFSFNAVNPGQYTINVSRRGVPSTGITTIQKNFLINALSPPVTTHPPTISVSTSGSGLGTVFTVSGFGFLPNTKVSIRVTRIGEDGFQDVRFGQDVNQQLIKSNGDGKLLNVKIGFSCISGLVFHFSATDGRTLPDAIDHTGFLFSNTINVSCPG